MEEKRISVIIPAYNCVQYICQALDSALIQDVPMEILVLNDGSQDDLDSVMRKYRDDPQIRYYQNERNLGVAETRNRGVAMAKGDYIAFLDADDVWAEGKLKKQLDRMRETGCVLCSTARELMNTDGSLTGCVIPVKTEYTYRDLLTGNQVNCSSVLIKTEVAREFPMHHDKCHEDYMMWLEVLQKYGKGCAVNEPLLKYRISRTGRYRAKLKSAKMTFLNYREMGFGWIRSCWYFLGYAFHGMKKFFPWFWRGDL